MEAEVANDTRGWVMSCVSGVACVLGASIICVDIFARRCLGNNKFRVAESNGFLSASLSLSSGVMLFTSLYSMLPTSKKYLIRAGFSPSPAAFILIGLFLAGVVVIQVVSSFIHRHIPSHIVDCSHSHEHSDVENHEGRNRKFQPHSRTAPGDGTTENSPLLARDSVIVAAAADSSVDSNTQATTALVQSSKLPHAFRLPKQISSLVVGTKPFCDQNGPCYGLSQACGQECVKTVQIQKQTDIQRNAVPRHHSTPGDLEAAENVVVDGEAAGVSRIAQAASQEQAQGHPATGFDGHVHSDASVHEDDVEATADESHNAPQQHHHHVPQNAFLSLGLQTSVAIALHKLPEGFITYATNHTSPTLGFSVFLALFIHNISEGFAMALPLYLALNSRVKAMLWSSLLGGISQPAGAGIAALWIWCAGKANKHPTDGSKDGPSWAVYGGMFAATAGVMTSVALQLFSESLGLSHNRALCIGFTIIGMGVLGLSSALTAS